MDKNTIYVPAERAKNGIEGWLLFNDDAKLHLRQWIADNKLKGADRLFKISGRAVEYSIKRYAQAAGIDKVVTPHSLRHFFGTEVYK